MDKIKEKLLNLLCENARYSFFELADFLGISEKQVEALVKELEDSGVIVKYSAIVNTEALEKKHVQALIEVKVAPQKLKGFDSYAEDLYAFSEVKSLYLMSGGFDLAVFVECTDLSEVAKFVSEKLSVIDGITGVATHFILRRYKIEGQITNPKKELERELF